MSDNESTSPEPAGESGADDFMKRFPASDFDPDAGRHASRLVIGPGWTWVCDKCGRDAGNGIAVFNDAPITGNSREVCCVVGVFCPAHRPRRWLYKLPLRELRGVAFIDSMRQLLGKSWFDKDAAHELCDRFLRGLHVAPALR